MNAEILKMYDEAIKKAKSLVEKAEDSREKFKLDDFHWFLSPAEIEKKEQSTGLTYEKNKAELVLQVYADRIAGYTARLNEIIAAKNNYIETGETKELCPYKVSKALHGGADLILRFK